jgi:hypothetical protein
LAAAMPRMAVPPAVMAPAHRPRRAGVTTREGRAVGVHRVQIEVISVRCPLVGLPTHRIER